MKKISLYFLLALVGMLTTACNEDFKDWNDPQAWGPEGAIQIEGFSASAAQVVDLNALQNDSAKLFTLHTRDLPEGYVLDKARIVLAPAEVDGVAPSTVNTDLDGVCADAFNTLQTIVQNSYGLRPVERPFNGHVYVDAMKDGQAVLIDAGPVTVFIVPQAPEIEDAYYITGTCNGWNNSNTDFELSNGGADPYENPEFTCMVPADKVDGDLEFKVTPKSGIGGDWSKCLCNDDANPGKFVGNNAGGNFKVAAVAGAKFYKVTFNMLNMTWNVEALAFGDYIYEIGSNTSWSSVIPMKHINGQGQYVGYAYLDSEFKFKPNADNWNGDWGQDPKGPEGTLVVDGEENCKVDHAAWYMMTVDLSAMTWQLKEITAIGIIGSAVAHDSNWTTEFDMTYNASAKCWEITTDLNAGEFKFRANKAWDGLDWGGTPSALRNGGENLVIETDGNYTIKLYPICDGQSHCTIVKN